MASNFWTSRIAAAKRQYASQHHHRSSHLDRFNIDDFEVEEEVRPDFPCPYCDEDFDIGSLCSHLEDEHSYESKVARHRRLHRVAIPNSQALSLLGRDLREAHLQVLLGGGGHRSNNTNANVSNASTDPFLSSFILNFHTSEAEEISKLCGNEYRGFFCKEFSTISYVEIKFRSFFEYRREGKKDEASCWESWFCAGFASLNLVKQLIKAGSQLRK
ncbi:hypothetical protein OIU77_009371 [Salix suchowensis]|uniref:Uncharacterized protein n=1 Tax=Salix suchowensis TaxID=1278906 RepID=A0ABQ9AF74_9ROSI|nr:hypothetical protein OIU77_009371 [Salix suchowensis]